MVDNETTLGRRAGSDGTVGLISAYVREQGRIASELPVGADPGRRIEALTSFASYVESRLQDDQRIRALYVLMGHTGSTDEHQPGENQRQLIALLGADRGAPRPDATLTELVGAAVDDVVVVATERASQAVRERDQAVAEVDAAKAAASAAETASEELEALRAENRELTATLAAKEEQINNLTAMVGGRAGRRDAPESRRRVVKGHPGVYQAQTARGPVFEVGFTRDGKQQAGDSAHDAEGLCVPGLRLRRRPDPCRRARRWSNPSFPMRVYAKAVRRRQRLSGTYLAQFDAAIAWASFAGADEVPSPEFSPAR